MPVPLRMAFWRPRSVLQLVLASFFTALAPLAVAMLFTVQTLGELAEKSLAINSTVVDVTRIGQEVERDLLELERRARQYQALAEPELVELFQRERTRLIENLQSLQRRLRASSPDVETLLESLERVNLEPPVFTAPDPSGASTPLALPQLERSFDVIGEQGSAVQQWLKGSVDLLLEQNAEEADALIDALMLQLYLLATVALALLLLFAYWINRPVRDLTQEIHQLGTEGLSHTIEISGPQEMRDLGTKLERLRQQLEDTEQQKQRFLRHVSHELKTPLSSLREGAELLADQVPGHLSRQQLEIVEILRDNGIELQRLIENLIDYNQLPRQEITPESFSVEDVIQALLMHYRIGLDNRRLTLELEGSVTHWTADRAKIRTAIDNLLSNAVNYTPEGGRIEVVWREEGANLVLDVANTGDPIPEKDAESVFEPFVQSAARRTGPIKGSGIGLSVARECLEVQGGSLTLVEHPDFPVCFRLTCPAHTS